MSASSELCIPVPAGTASWWRMPRGIGRWSAIAFFDDRWPDIAAVGDWSGRSRCCASGAARRDGGGGPSATTLAASCSVASSPAAGATGDGDPSVQRRQRLGCASPGTVLLAGAVVNPRARIGEAAIVNTPASTTIA